MMVQNIEDGLNNAANLILSTVGGKTALRHLIESSGSWEYDLGVTDIPGLGMCGTLGLYDYEDEQYYIMFGFCFSGHNILAEVDDNTYGTMMGFRVYLEAEGRPGDCCACKHNHGDESCYCGCPDRVDPATCEDDECKGRPR